MSKEKNESTLLFIAKFGENVEGKVSDFELSKKLEKILQNEFPEVKGIKTNFVLGKIDKITLN